MKILLSPNEILTIACDPVAIPCDLENEVEQMLGLIQGIGVGLAANQVGILKRFCVFNTPLISVKYMVNPEMVWHSKKAGSLKEECLSTPGVYVPKKRYSEITVCWQNMQGLVFNKTFRGMAARVIQHELDHLNGILISTK